MTPFMLANSGATHQPTNLNSIHFITSNITKLKPQIFLKHIQSFFSKWQTKGRLSSSSHRRFILPQSPSELLLEHEKDVESAVSLVLQFQGLFSRDLVVFLYI